MPGLNILQNGPVKHSPTEESAAEVLANLSVQSVMPQTKVVPELTVDGKHISCHLPGKSSMLMLLTVPRSLPYLQQWTIPSLKDLDATVASWRARDDRRPSNASSITRRSSYQSDANWSEVVATPSLSSPGLSSAHLSPLMSPRTPRESRSPSFQASPNQSFDSSLSSSEYSYYPQPQHTVKLPRLCQPRIHGSHIGPVSDGIKKRRAPKKTENEPHFNQKYMIECRNFMLYQLIDIGKDWLEVVETYHSHASKLIKDQKKAEIESKRRIQGLQGCYYRLNNFVPALDKDGNLLFNDDGKEYTILLQVRQQKDELLGLIDRYPERVCYENYSWVSPEHMKRAEELTARRNQQRLARGLPPWSPKHQETRVVHTHHGNPPEA